MHNTSFTKLLTMSEFVKDKTDVQPPISIREGIYEQNAYGYKRIINLLFNPNITGTSKETFHPYCSFAEVAYTRIIRDENWSLGLIIQNKPVVIAGNISNLPIPIKQINTESSVLLINGKPFLVEEVWNGEPRRIVRPLFILKEDLDALASAQPASSDNFLLPRVELPPADFDLLTKEVFGHSVSQEDLSDIYEGFWEGDLTVKVGDRFLNKRLIELSQLGYRYRRSPGSLEEVVSKMQKTYTDIISAGAPPAELLEYAARAIKIHNLVASNEGVNEAAGFASTANISESLELLGKSGTLRDLPFRMQYILMSQMSISPLPHQVVAMQLLDSLTSVENFNRVKLWDFTRLLNLAHMVTKNIGKGLVDALPDKLIVIMIEKNVYLSFIGLLVEFNHGDVDLIDKKFRGLPKKL